MNRRLTTLIVVMILTCATVAVAAQQSRGKPFAEIWAELSNLLARIVALESGGSGDSSLQVVDSTNVVIGQLISPSNMIVKIDGYTLFVPVAEEGFPEEDVGFVYDGPDCTGNAFFSFGREQRTPLVRRAFVDGGTGYFPGEPAGFVAIRSRSFSGRCNNSEPPENEWVAAIVLFSPSDVGSPPFHLR